MALKKLPILDIKDEKPCMGMWHGSKKYGYLTVAGTITGCGLAQIRGISSQNNVETFKPILEEIKVDYKLSGAGAIIATLGQLHYDKEKLLLDLGFEFLKEYHNYRHGSDYLQKLYILTL